VAVRGFLSPRHLRTPSPDIKHGQASSCSTAVTTWAKHSSAAWRNRAPEPPLPLPAYHPLEPHYLFPMIAAQAVARQTLPNSTDVSQARPSEKPQVKHLAICPALRSAAPPLHDLQIALPWSVCTLFQQMVRVAPNATEPSKQGITSQPGRADDQRRATRGSEGTMLPRSLANAQHGMPMMAGYITKPHKTRT